MKTKITYLLSALGMSAATALTMSACRDYDVFEEEEATIAKMDKQYDDAFFKIFGTIDPKNDFGMSEPLQRMGWGSGATRAAGVNTNRNMWVDREGSSEPYSSRPYKNDALAHDIIIPGWPNFDGYYYGNYGGSALQNTWTDTNLPNGAQPCGDVTDYEIQYVSAWFRTHHNPVSNCELHLSDFFIQNVSVDNDQKAYTDIVSTDKTGKNGDNVLTGTDQGAYNNINRISGTEQVNFSLDQLGFKSMDGDWTHVNNFNNQNSNYNPEEATSTPNREIKYITSSGTEDFRCHPSFNTKPETDWIYSYVLMHLTWEEKVTNPSSPDYNKYVQREGYYLAFDFQANKDETKVSCDGYYSNWIVKITPGYFASTGVARRIMCEDLGGTYDFDFNDLVVDVALDYGGEPIISVQAAGGTMPIYLDERTDPKYEIHSLLGAPSTQPVNVLSDYSHQHAPAIFRGKVYLVSPDMLTIKVQNTQNNQTYTINGRRANLDSDYGTPYDKNGKIPPRSFAVPTSVKWMKELTFIDKSYPGFKNWVADVNYMYKPSEQATLLHWYEQSKVQEDLDPKTSYMYYPSITMENGSPRGDKTTLTADWTTLRLADAAYGHASAVGAFGSVWIDGYTGGASIIDNLKNNNAQMVTLTVIFKSKTQYPDPEYDSSGDLTNGNNLLQAILIPADILTEGEKTGTDKTMKYQGFSFNKDIIQTWRVAQLQNYAGQDENSLMMDKDFTGFDFTYALKMTFTRDQLLQSASPEDFVDHIFLFIKSPDNGNVKMFNWHVHY